MASAVTANAQEIPQTEAIQIATQNFIASNIAVCKKHELPEDMCKANIQNKIDVIVARYNRKSKRFWLLLPRASVD